MRTDQGAAQMNHCPHDTSIPMDSEMNPTATRFCAAAVLMPMFQMDTDWAAAMTRRAPRREFLARPKAATMPNRIGTTAPARAEAEGTKNARTIEMTMAPSTTG